MPTFQCASQNKPTVVGLVGQDGYGILRLNSRRFAEALERRGYTCAILNINQSDFGAKFNEIIESGDFSFAFGFSGVGSYLLNGDSILWDTIRVPFLALHLDNPCHHPAQHGANSSFVANVYVAKDSFDTEATFIRSSRPSYLIRRPLFIDPQRTILPWNDRPIQYLYVKTGADPTPYEIQSQTLPPYLNDVFWDCVRHCEKRTDFVLADVVAKRLDLPPARINVASTGFWTLVHLIESFLRAKRMTWLATMLKDLPATIIGDGWDHVDKTGAKATFLPGKAASEVSELYGQSKFVFNVNPATDHGVEERVFMGLNAWSGVVSDNNLFSRTHFGALPNFFGFDWADPHKDDRIVSFLNEQQLSPSHCYEGWKIAQSFANLNDFVDVAEKIVSEIRSGKKAAKTASKVHE